MSNKNKEPLEKTTPVKPKRRIKIFRLIFSLIIFMLISLALLFIGMTIYNTLTPIHKDFEDIYQGSNERNIEQFKQENLFDSYTNILLISDQPQSKEADIFFMMSISNSSGKIQIISIPPNTLIDSTPHIDLLSSIYSLEGVNIVVREVSKLLGISIQQYVIIDTSTLVELIDVLGGLDLYVEENMNCDEPTTEFFIHISQGYQHLSGEEVQKYLCYRDENLGDIGRVQRHQKILKILYSKILQMSTVSKLPAIADIFRTKVETSVEIFDSAHLANVLRKISSELPKTYMISGSYNEDGAWIPNKPAIETQINELLTQSSPTNDSE